MNLTNGLKQMWSKSEAERIQKASVLNESFAQLKKEAEQFVNQSANAYVPISKILSNGQIPERNSYPRGFRYGEETISSIPVGDQSSFPQKSGDSFLFPLIHDFMSVGATAIEEHGGSAHLLFNFALRAISSFLLGDANVYMLDSNVSGDFNRLSPISTDMNDYDLDKNLFHYITSDSDKNTLLTDLLDTMDRNIRNYVSIYPNLYEYNLQNEVMHVAYNFVFIKDVGKTLADRSQLDMLTRLVSDGNATKAGIFVFYTYDMEMLKKEDFHSGKGDALRQLLGQSHVIERIEHLDAGSELVKEPKADSLIVNRVINYVNTSEMVNVSVSFEDEIESMLEAGNLWSSPIEEKKGHLYIPLGYRTAITKKEIDISFAGNSPHIFVGGKSGSGKSILLHNLILNGAMKYSPKQLRYYLADMKGGVSFVSYKRLPHMAALSASSSRHYATSLLEILQTEIERRASLFRKHRVTSLSAYNEMAEKNGMEHLPYVFAIIDEFQVLFEKNDTISSEATKKIEFIHKQGRSQGVILALCSQQPPSGINCSQVGIKISLSCRPNDSNAIIGNDGAAKLRGIGRTIINTNAAGEEKFNQEFQTANVDENKLYDYVARINEIWLDQNNGVDPYDHLVYDDNELDVELNSSILERHDTGFPNIYIGAPGFYRKEHEKFYFHRDSQSNVVVVGVDRPSAMRLAGIVTLQFIEAYPNTGSHVYIADLQRQNEPTYGKLEFLGDDENVSHCNAQGVKYMLNEVYKILEQRKQDRTNSEKEPEILLILADLKPDNYFKAEKGGYNFGGVQEKSALDMLGELVEDGPDLGIHVMVYCYNYQNMSQMLNNFNNSLLARMEVRICLRGGDSGKLLGFGHSDIVDKYGEAFIRMPEEMGLKYYKGDDAGDPFRIYDKVGDEKLVGTLWDTLFSNLPDRDID